MAAEKYTRLSAPEILILTKVADFHKTVKESFASPAVVVDFSENREIDTSGLQLLLYWKKFAEVKNKKFAIINHSSALLSIMGLYGVIGLFADKIQLKAGDREEFGLSYGLKKERFL